MTPSLLTPPSSPRSHARLHAFFPFDCIVVTSPDEASAQSAQLALSRTLERRLNEEYPLQVIRIVSTFDPYGARCGSGGGTLAAMEFARPGETVLILHAGGDSSRCPTQMILGKAWTSLPSAKYPNPTIWLIDQIQSLFEQARFPRGTVVVAATDTLITFFDKTASSLQDTAWNLPIDTMAKEATVLGVAVPALVSTAKNHGVYLLSELAHQGASGSLVVMDPLEVWQKPSMEKLLDTRHPAPASFVVQGEQRMAWIDTGVIIFSPKVVQVLLDLSHGILAMCTRKGIQDAYDQQPTEQKDEQSLEDFAKTNALKIDLYTEILHNLSWPTQPSNPNKSTLEETLSRIPLKILAAPQGKFLHLGTTQELVDFVTSGAYTTQNSSLALPQYNMSNLSEHVTLQPRFQCWETPYPLAHNVTLQSTFPVTTTIGTSSLVEFCDLDGYESVSIGSNSMLSGWRNPTLDTASLAIPNNVVVQLIALTQVNRNYRQFVYMVLGMGDGIKENPSKATIFGLPLSTFFHRTGLKPEDLGWTDDMNNTNNHNLWNAMLHPVVTQGTPFSSLYAWLDKLPEETATLKDDPSFSQWLSMPRITLKQLHDVADAKVEWIFRQDLESRIGVLQRTNIVDYVVKLVQKRRHDRPCDLQWILDVVDLNEATDLVLEIVQALENVALEQLALHQFDICGRAFMIASALLADFDSVLADNDKKMDASDDIVAFCSPIILELRSSSMQSVPGHTRTALLSTILDYRRSYSSELLAQNLSTFSLVMERLSFCMNELSIASGYLQFILPYMDTKVPLQRSRPPVLNKWTISTAPARVDLAGGWTDTPPLCFEYGGSVTGMAVLIDHQRPLSCRCRISLGKTGILLRTENRSSDNGALLSFLETEVTNISDIGDFRDPLSDCALLKAALVCLGLVTEDQIHNQLSLQPLMNRFCNSDSDVRMEIVTASILPQGSGMGTSSILAAAVLACITHCVGLGVQEEDFLLHGVLMLEQLLTSGGGWQDQAHGIVPGIKTVRSIPPQLPISISVDRLDVKADFEAQLSKRMILVFTGMTRLAKNILQGVLRRWARSTNEVVAIVARNIQLAEECSAAVLAGDMDNFARILLEYSSIKVQMAGKDGGAMPDSCRVFISELLRRDAIKGACLCGAGGGGFMVMIASENENKESLEALIRTELVPKNQEFETYTLHSCDVCHNGLTTRVIEDDAIGLNDYSLTW